MGNNRQKTKMIKRLAIVLFIAGGIVFVPYWLAILINKLTGMDVGIDDGNAVVWICGFILGGSSFLVSGLIWVILTSVIKYIIKG